MEKEYDLFANILKNPDFSYNDFIAAGLTADNTLLQSKDYYKKSDKVKQTFTDITGKFDNDKFDKVYNIATTLYNSLAMHLTIKLLPRKQFIIEIIYLLQ